MDFFPLLLILSISTSSFSFTSYVFFTLFTESELTLFKDCFLPSIETDTALQREFLVKVGRLIAAHIPELFTDAALSLSF
jgi:hypothetical protein